MILTHRRNQGLPHALSHRITHKALLRAPYRCPFGGLRDLDRNAGARSQAEMSMCIKEHAGAHDEKPSDGNVFDLVSMGTTLWYFARISIPLALVSLAASYPFAASLVDAPPPFWPYIGGLAWRVPVCWVCLCLWFITFGFAVRLCLRVARTVSVRLTGPYRKLCPQEFALLVDQVDKHARNAMGWVWVGGGLGVAEFVIVYTPSVFWCVFASSLAASVTAFVLLLRSNKRIGRWAFHQLRRLIAPYVILTPSLCALAMYGVVGGLHIAVRFGFVHEMPVEMLAAVFSLDAPTRDAFVSMLVARTSPLAIPFQATFAACLWSTLCTMVAITVVGMALKREYVGVALLAATASAPFVLPGRATVLQLFPEESLPHLSPAGLSVLLVIGVRLCYSLLCRRLGLRSRCDNCSTPIATVVRYCPNCGMRNLMADRW
jgi:hypothetical protein